MRKRYLTVIKNDIGIREYDLGIDESENLKVYELPESEFEVLYNKGIFMKINNECNRMIEDYESELLDVEDLYKCAKYMTEDVVKAAKVFNTVVLDATKNGVALGIDF